MRKGNTPGLQSPIYLGVFSSVFRAGAGPARRIGEVPPRHTGGAEGQGEPGQHKVALLLHRVWLCRGGQGDDFAQAGA